MQIKAIFKDLLLSIKSMRLKYLPLLTVYFSYNFANFSNIAEMFWQKNSLSLSASELVSITIWANLPWSMKIIFAQFLDSVRIFGSQRRIYIFIGAFLMLLGNFFTISIANNITCITSLTTTYNLLLLGGFLGSCGFVLQDLVADTLCYEVIDKYDENLKPKQDDEIKNDIANLQMLIRVICIPVASILAAYLSEFISVRYDYKIISLILPITAIFSIIGSVLISEEPKVVKERINISILIFGMFYALIALIFALINFKYSQELVFLVGMLVVSIALYKICDPLTLEEKKEVFAILIVIFVTRSVPTYGPGVEWWQIDVLGFTPDFFAKLVQFSLVLSFLGLWIFGKKLVNYNIAIVLLVLNIIHVILQLPMIAMAFGLHEWTEQYLGFGARTIAFLDNTAEAPFTQLNFFLLCTIATYRAPKHNVANWFALVMSLMSLAYVFLARIIKRYLSEIFVIERGQYDNVADLMIATTLINFAVPTIVILVFMNPFKKGNYILNK